ncbi:MAG: MATE family efflux transporter [Victivallales bacterium]|nr:MATE family efflux transporter [Victivallales bacterium]
MKTTCHGNARFDNSINQPSMKAEYTQGSIVATMLKTSFAMLASTLAVSGYNIADTYFVGQLSGAGPLAAMGFTFPVVMLVGCIFMGLGTGCMATIGQAVGRDDQGQVRQLIASGMLLVTILAILLGLGGILLGENIYRMMGAQGATLKLVKKYMDIWFLGCVTMGLSNEGNKILIACGKPKLSSAVTMLGMLVNVILDPLLIFGGERCHAALLRRLPECLGASLRPLSGVFSLFAEHGISGAAVATVVSQAVAAVVILCLLWRIRLLQCVRLPWQRILGTWRIIVTYAIPATLGMLLNPISNGVTTWVTAHFGDTLVAATAAASRLEVLAWVYPMSFGISIMPIASQNYGARLYSRVRRGFNFAVAVATSYLCVVSVIIMVFAPRLVTHFTDVQAVRDLMVTYLRIVPWGFAMLELTRYCGNVLTGCGHPNQDAALKVLRTAGLLIPFSLLTLALDWQPGVFYSRLATDIIAGAVCLVVTYRMLRKLPEDGLPPDNHRVEQAGGH